MQDGNATQKVDGQPALPEYVPSKENIVWTFSGGGETHEMYVNVEEWMQRSDLEFADDTNDRKPPVMTLSERRAKALIIINSRGALGCEWTRGSLHPLTLNQQPITIDDPAAPQPTTANTTGILDSDRKTEGRKLLGVIGDAIARGETVTIVD